GIYSYYSNGLLKNTSEDNLSFEYNSTGKTTRVLKNGSLLNEIFYDERGHRIKKVTYTPSNTVSNTTYYTNDIKGSILKVVSVSGTAVTTETMIYGYDRIGEFNSTLGKWVYEIKDHLGNVRASVCSDNGGIKLIKYNDFYAHGNILPGRSFTDGTPY